MNLRTTWDALVEAGFVPPSPKHPSVARAAAAVPLMALATEERALHERLRRDESASISSRAFHLAHAGGWYGYRDKVLDEGAPKNATT